MEKHVLVASRSAELSSQVCERLEEGARQWGCDLLIDRAANLHDAERRVERVDYDLIISEVDLPLDRGAIDQHVGIADHIDFQVTRFCDRLHGLQRTGHGSAVLCGGVPKTRPQLSASSKKCRGSFGANATKQLEQ